ncbi:MAG: hypothetical protein L0J38_01520 [Corynebacterium casei]|nr:hypothetical protein [Corynebacterium casei]
MPIPAFISMPESWATDLAVDPALVREKALPWLILAISFTVINMCISTTRMFWTTNFNTKLSRRIFIFSLVFIVLIPLLLSYIAFHGPIPLAVIFYWFCTNLYTLTLTIICQIVLTKKYPLSEEVHEMRRKSIADFKDYRKLSSSEKKELQANAKADKKQEAEIRREASKIRVAKRRAELQAKRNSGTKPEEKKQEPKEDSAEGTED